MARDSSGVCSRVALGWRLRGGKVAEHRCTQLDDRATGLRGHTLGAVDQHGVERRHLAHLLGAQPAQRRPHLGAGVQRRDRIVQVQPDKHLLQPLLGALRGGRAVGRPSSRFLDGVVGVLVGLPVGKHLLPGTGHVIGGIEAFPGVTIEGLEQKLGQFTSELRVHRHRAWRREWLRSAC